ncbi:methyltransferase domain-containing protein [Desulfobacterota bacterium AH_259_B03_O07]|nr:methyltransferase domain-containing protein [Desulfobacterota bacterium AH_259_B03_O07]
MKLFFNSHKKIVRKYYNRIADMYERLIYTDPTEPKAILKRYEKMFHSLELKDARNLIELGAGNGVFTIPIALKAPWVKIYALDISDRMIIKLRKKIIKKNIINCYVTVGDYDFPPFKNNLFDRVLFSFSIEDSLEPKNSINESKKLLKQGGKLVILGIGGGKQSIDSSNLDEFVRQKNTGHGYYLDQEDTERILKEFGFKNINGNLVYMDKWIVENKKIKVPLYVVSGYKI